LVYRCYQNYVLHMPDLCGTIIKERYRKRRRASILDAGGKMDWKNVIGSNRVWWSRNKGPIWKGGRRRNATGCCMLIRRDVLERIVIFDDKLFSVLWGCDLTMRAKKNGLRLFMCLPYSLKKCRSTGGSGRPFRDYYITRHRFVTYQHAAFLASGEYYIFQGAWTQNSYSRSVKWGAGKLDIREEYKSLVDLCSGVYKMSGEISINSCAGCVGCIT